MKRLSFTLLAVVVLLLAAATFVEKYLGTEFVRRYIYGSAWFAALWALLAAGSFAYLLRHRLQRHPSAFLLHMAFLVILAGALLTSLTARHGAVHLRLHEPVSGFSTQEGSEERLPFSLTLDTFRVVYYPGTNAAADYVSGLTVSIPGGEDFRAQVSMNRIFAWRGIRFYQASYDSDGRGTLLSVNCDRWGIPVTYAGYILLFVAMVWNLFSKRGYLRRTLKDPHLKRGMLAAVLLLAAGTVHAGGRSLSKECASELGRAQVLFNGRIMPVQTLAYDFTLKLTGKTHYEGYTAEQVFAGWLLFPSSWQEEPMIRVKDAGLRKALAFDKEYVSLEDFFTERNEYRLETYLNCSSGKMKKAAREADEKVRLTAMLRRGELFKAYPVTAGRRTVWYAPSSPLPEETDNDRWLYIRKGMNYLAEATLKNDDGQVGYFISKLITYQQKNGGASVLSPIRVGAERLYNSIPFSTLLYRINLSAGLLALLLFGCVLLRGGRPSCVAGVLFRFCAATLLLSFFALTCCLVLRGYIGKRLPMGNGYETMTAMAWCGMLTAILLRRRFRLLLPFGLLLSGFCLLVASLGRMNPQITPLVPVLSSPLLSLHVSLIMMSYALFAFTFLNGILGVMSCREGTGDGSVRLQVFSKVFLLPALFLLGAGIFVGAIWANVSWGRYWAWDPKEVWALITFLVYAFALHDVSLPAFRKPLFFHSYMIIAFFTIVMTYFGVNYFLGGMHSYAG